MALMRRLLKYLILLLVLSLKLISVLVCCANTKEESLIAITVASEANDGFQRFNRSCGIYKLQCMVLGLNEQWQGGDTRYRSGGYKIMLLKHALEKLLEDNLIILFTDSYDVIYTSGVDEIFEKFYNFDANVVFGAEEACWPDASLNTSYPLVKKGKRYLNSGGFIGYAKTVYQIIKHMPITDTDDDQLYYTNIFLNEDLRKNWRIKLDHQSTIFQNLHGAVDEVTLIPDDEGRYRLLNEVHRTLPVIIHGNGESKISLNYFGNYLAENWIFSKGCVSCEENSINDLAHNHPRVLIGIFIEQPAPYLDLFLERISNQIYPKDKIDLFVHVTVEAHVNDTLTWWNKHSLSYLSQSLFLPSDKISNNQARNMAIKHCMVYNCEYYFSIDNDCMLTSNKALYWLVYYNSTIVAPLLLIPGRLWSNYWGAVGSNGYYVRSRDYIDIVEGKKIGIWNVPYIRGAVLIHKNRLKPSVTQFDEGRDFDMHWCAQLRSNGIFMYVNNMHHFGHLLHLDSYSTEHLHNDLYQIIDNPTDWELKYIHENYSLNLQDDHEIEMPCNDVYWFPIVSEIFCKHLVEEMEYFGQWSTGGHEDGRLDGGYENVPTRDIHMKQIGLEKQWLHFLKKYIVPVQAKVFPGYYSKGYAYMNFVVKYHPQGQSSLRPHHDASVYTINIALTRAGIDYEGGGCRFIRQKCQIVDTRLGWSFVHPGRLTHYHEGLPTTKGTRYIMVSFIDS